MKQIAISLSLLLTAAFSWAQNGNIRGSVIDKMTGQPLFMAAVAIPGTSTGVSTDFDGKFDLSLAPGSYDIQISFIGLSTVTVTGVMVKADETTVMNPISLEPASTTLKQYTVTAKAAQNSETAVMTMKKKSVNVLDGISAQTIKKSGDSDAAAAVKRVPGVSIQGGKYVYVRGLGDRYTKTQLNGMDIPGLDPDRNSLQMDIFPTNVVDQLIVLKSFTADLPADFTGGVVNIATKDFPEEKTLEINASVGFTPGMHLNDEYLSQDGSSTDFLGFDGGLRSEPLDFGPKNTTPILQPANSRSNAPEATREFNPNLAALQQTSLMNFNLGISGGNQFKRDDKTWGINGSFSYKNNTDFFQDREQNFYFKELNDNSVYELDPNILQKGDLGVNNVFMSALAGIALKTDSNKYRLSLLHLQNGETRSGYFREEQIISNSATIFRDNLEYSERSITNLLLAGTHVRGGGDWTIDWKLSPTLSRIQDKDVRITPYLFQEADSSYSIDPSEAAVPQRIWRNLTEYNVSMKGDITKKHQALGSGANLRFGALASFKYRTYEILNYNLESISPGTLPFTGNADELLTDRFIWERPKGEGMYLLGSYQPSNTYEGIQTTGALYISEELQLMSKLKAIVGVRMEKYDQFYTGENQSGTLVFENENVLDLLDFFPTASFIYQPNDNSNIRAGYFRTTARPSFKEKSTAEIVDVISKVTFIGNIELEQTNIDNYDLRYEYFFKKNQTLAVSGFYKTFENPIELASYQQDPNSIQPRNVGDAEVLGIEFEGRLNMGFLKKTWDVFSLNTNVSIINSRVEYDKSPGGTFDGKLNAIREGEELGNFRDMQGQSPYIVNAGFSYKGKVNDFEAGLFYNVQGPKLMIVGINRAPDVYSVPFHSLNFTAYKKFGIDKEFQVGVRVSNILDDAIESETDSFRAEARVFNRFNPGRTFTVTFKYELF